MSERRKQLVTFNRERIEHAHAQAVEQGRDRPIILALDLEDSFAKQTASAFTTPQKINEYIQQSHTNNLEPILITDLEYDAAIELLAPLSQSGKSHIEQCTHKGLIVVCTIGDGGISWSSFSAPN